METLGIVISKASGKGSKSVNAIPEIAKLGEGASAEVESPLNKGGRVAD